jgi:hypothetical protein
VPRCVEDGIECNTANLIINHGWTGLLFDGDAEDAPLVVSITDGTLIHPSNHQPWSTPIDRDNANALIASQVLKVSLTLLARYGRRRLLDPRHYHVYSTTCHRPEFADAWGPDVSVTIPYRSNFHRTRQDST